MDWCLNPAHKIWNSPEIPLF